MSVSLHQTPLTSPETPDLYRRRRAVVPHRRKGVWLRLIRPLLVAVAIVGVPSGIALWAATTPYLEISQVAVSGTERVSSAWVESALGGLEGRHLLWTGLEDVESRLETHEWIRGLTLRKELPDRIHVVIDERQPVAVLRKHGNLYFVERDGAVIAEYDARLIKDELLILDAPRGIDYEIEPALALAAEWQRLAPPWSGALSEIEIVSEEDFRVHVDALEFPVFVSPEGLAAGLDRLTWLLPELDRRYPAIASVDIRFSRQIIFEPAARPQTEEG